MDCIFLDEKNQCSNDDIDSIECLERQGYKCQEKKTGEIFETMSDM